jgi:hypothetical protein
MTAKPDQQERAGNAAAGRAIELSREKAGLEALEQKQHDIVNLTDAEFDAGLERVQKRQARMRRILATALIREVHYGTADGVFKKPMCYKAGQEELRNLFGLKIVILEREVIQTAEHTSVWLTVACQDRAGRLLAPRSGACSSLERRFKKFNGKGFTWDDARETLSDCLQMAEKRAGNLSTLEATGASAFLSAEDEIGSALAERGVDAPQPWTDEERLTFFADAKAAGIATRNDLKRFVIGVLGGDREVLSLDLKDLYAALEARKTAGVPPVKQAKLDDATMDAELAEPEA